MRDKKFRGKRIDSSEWVFGESYARVKNIFAEEHIILVNGLEVDSKSVGQFIEVHDDIEDKELYEGDIIEMLYEGQNVVGSIQYSYGGYLLASDDFVDGFMWITDLVENDGRYFWIPTSKLIGNMTDDGDSYCCT